MVLKVPAAQKKKRKKAGLILVAGTFPVLISGFGQYFFEWTGPLEILNGLVVWYQRPLVDHGLTGPFNNQNYAGAWLSLVWPFSIALLVEKTNSSLKKFTAISFFLSPKKIFSKTVKWGNRAQS